MYFWRINYLKEQLASRPLSEREQLPYLVAFVVLYGLGQLIPEESRNGWDLLGDLFSVGLAGFGTVYLYFRNGGSSGSNFVQRYLAIGFVVGLRWFCVVFVAGFLMFASLAVAGLATDETTWIDILVLALAELVLYQRIGHHIHDVSARTARLDPAQPLPASGPATGPP